MTTSRGFRGRRMWWKSSFASTSPSGTWRPQRALPALFPIAKRCADGRRLVIKAVNYQAERNTLSVRLQGASIPEKAAVKLHTITAGLTDAASMEHPDAIATVSRVLEYNNDFSVYLDTYTVAVVEIRSE